MADFMTDVLNTIRYDRELKSNSLLMAVVETLERKRPSYRLEEDYLQLVRGELDKANAYCTLPQNKILEPLIAKIEERLSSQEVSNVHTKVARMYYEIDFPGAINALRESSIYSEPVVKNYVDNAMAELQTKNVPYFKYLPGFIATMSTYRTDSTVNEWVEFFEGYIRDNMKKLVLLEAVHYLDGIGNNFYHGVTEKLKPFLVRKEYSSSKIMLEMKDFNNIPVLKDMIIALQSHEANETKQFNLGGGDGNTRVFNYVGPVLKENNSMVLFLDSSFISITADEVDESSSSRVLGTTGELTVHELKPEYVFENMKEYYQVAKSFEYLKFGSVDDGVSAQLRNIKVDFKVNEAGNLDLFINDMHIENPGEINYHQMFVLENNYVKNCSTVLFENMDKVYNVEFVKFLINESRNAAAIIININEDYYVYDYVDARSRDIYKTNGFGIAKFVSEKFGYDVRELFKLQIDDVKSKVQSIDEKKLKIDGAIAKLEESHKLLDETIGRGDVSAKDKEYLKTLSEKVEKEIVGLKNAYILLDDERMQVLGQIRESDDSSIKTGDDVSYGESTGKVVAEPKGESGTHMVANKETGRMEKVKSSELSKSEGQETNEAKKEDGKNPFEKKEESDDDKGQKEEKDEKKEKKEEKEKKDDKPKKPAKKQPQKSEEKDDDDDKGEASQEPESQESQGDKQGIMPQKSQKTQKTQAAREKDSFNKMTSQINDLRQALETVRPEVKEKFAGIASDLDILSKQTGELERLDSEIGKLTSEMADKADVSKVDGKLNKIKNDLERVVAELTNEFGQGAQTIVISESQISVAYDRYIGVVDSVVSKLGARISNEVKKLSGDLIDLDADIKVASARAYAAKAKEELGSKDSGSEVPVAGPDAGEEAAKDEAQAQESGDKSKEIELMPHFGGDTAQEHEEHEAQETSEMQAAEHAEGRESQEQHGDFGGMPMMPGQSTQPVSQPVEQPVSQPVEQPVSQPSGFGGSIKNFSPERAEEPAQESDEEKEFYTAENLSSLSDIELAREYSNIFSISEADALVGILGDKQAHINELLHEYEIVMRSKK
jgi:tetrahydromethanopterin S-methyltransferase subunit G